MATLEPQEQLVDDAVMAYWQTVLQRRGRLLFLAGTEGGGRTRTLARIVESLSYEEPPALLIAGAMRADTFKTWPNDPAIQRNMVANQDRLIDRREVAEKAAEWLGLGSAFQPYLALLAGFISIASVASKLHTRLAGGPLGRLEKEDVPNRLYELLVQQADKRRRDGRLGPVVLLIDDLDEAQDPWLDIFLDRVSLGLPVERDPIYALVIVSLQGPASPTELADQSAALARLAHREQGRSAEWRWLRPLTSVEIDEWLGPMEEPLAGELATLTQGNTSDTAGLWAEWQSLRIVVRKGTDDLWRLGPDQEARSAGGRRLDAVIDRRLRSMVASGLARDTMRMVLCLGALEGPTFTASAVALACEPPLDSDNLIDEFDDVLTTTDDRPAGFLREAGWTKIAVPAGEPRYLNRYEFASPFYWRAFRGLVTPEQRPHLSHRLAEALIRLYGHEQMRATRLLSNLFADAGDQEKAEHFRLMTQRYASIVGLALYGRVLLAWPEEGWQPADFVQAAIKLNGLATLLHGRGVLAAARPLYERAVAIREKVLGPDHPDTAMSLNNLAGVLHGQGELAAARPLFERVLAIAEKVLGPEHPNTAVSLCGRAPNLNSSAHEK